MKCSIITLILFIAITTAYTQTRNLEYFIEQAKQNSPVLKDYQSQILINKIDSQLLWASLKTRVDFLSTNSYAPIIHGYGYDEAITNIANVSGLLQATRNFLSKQNIAAQYKTISLQRKALMDSLALSQQDLVRTVADQYITAYGDMLAMEYNKEVYDIMKKEEDALKKLTQASVYKQTDYLTFYVTMQQQELTYLQAQLQYNADYLTLQYITGQQDTAIGKLEKPALADTFSSNFNNTVFYTRFATDSQRLANEKELIAYEYKPRIGAYTDAGFNSSLQNTPYKNFGFSAGLSLTIPIYDSHQKQMKYDKINIQERMRTYNRDFFMRQYAMQVSQLKHQLNAINLLVSKIEKQIEYAHTLVTANNKLLQTGDITMKDYVVAVNNYLNAQNLLTQNNISRLKILNQLNYWNIK